MMKSSAVLLLALLAAEPRAAAPEYFSYARAVTVTDAARQQYVSLDAAIWEHARADLADVRLYDAAKAEVAFGLIVNAHAESSALRPTRLFNLAKGARGTEFLLEISQPEYNRIALDLDAHDFAGLVKVEASDDLNRAHWVEVGSYPVFDFSHEHLGKHSDLQLPTLRYRYLRLVLPPPLAPENVKAARVAAFETRTASWTALGATPTITQIASEDQLKQLTGMRRVEGAFTRATVITWSQPEHAPLDRVRLDFDSGVNFRRNVELYCRRDERWDIVARDEVWRIHLVRNGDKIDSERLEVNGNAARGKQFALLINNGDDPPPPLRAAHPEAIERRLYFDAQGHSGIKLYYGDEKARAPLYDYAKLLQRDAQAAAARLGPEERNAAFTPRPDQRPWSDRHPAVLWTVLVIAVLGLGALALRGFATG
jgi:hypothetical protein